MIEGLTKAQSQAVESRAKSVCVVAGAGTGKTRVLVERYISLLRDGLARVPQIVAITFTEKAAKEMKDRIREACLKNLYSSTAPEEQRRWREHRNDLDHAQISTIHSLCAQIIRECPVEAGVDPRFSVLDEVEANILLGKVAREELVSLIEAEDPEAMTLVAEYEFPSALELITQLVEHRDQMKSCLAGLPDLSDEKAILEQWNKQRDSALRYAVQRLMCDQGWRQAVKILEDIKPLNPNDKIVEQRLKLLDIVSRLEQTQEPALLAQICENCECRGGSQKNWAPGDLGRVKEAFKSIRKCVESYNLPQIGEAEYKALRMARALVHTANRVIDAYTRRKRDSGFLDFHDLELLTQELLLNNPSIQHRYRQRIRYVLVDEFQDTNQIQKEIVDALTGGEQTARLFVVGDAKQSIYRFRGADVSVFIKTDHAIEGAGGERVSLDTNFRSLPELVAFANHFFGKLMGEKPRSNYEAGYSELKANRRTTQERPRVEMILIRREEEDNADSLRRREAELIARRIRKMVDEEEPLIYGEDNAVSPVQFKDIAVLFRAMSNIWIYEQAMRKYEIPYYVIAGTGFYARQEIKDMLNLIRTLDNRMDDLSLAGVLRSPMFAISDNTLYWLCAERNVSLYERLLAHEDIKSISNEERPKLRHAAHVLQKLLAMRDRVSLPELLIQAVEMTRYDSVLLSQFLGKQKALNVYKLIDLARKFHRRGIFTLHDFADYVGEFVTSEVREGEAPLTEEAGNVVKMMTIHKAKGLEFPVVFVVDISRQEQRRGKEKVVYLDPQWGVALKIRDENDKWQKPFPFIVLEKEDNRKDEAETKRIFYVAVTRAKDFLVLSGWEAPTETNKKKQPGPWFTWLDEIFKLQDGGEDGAYPGGKFRILRHVPYTPGTAHGRHKSWAMKFPSEIAALMPLPIQVKKEADFFECFTRQIAPIAHSLKSKVRFSPTELQEYLWCPSAYYLRRIINLPTRTTFQQLTPQGHAYDAQLLGRVAHQAVLNLMMHVDDPIQKALHSTSGAELLAPEAQTKLHSEVEGMLSRFQQTHTYQSIIKAKESYCEFPFLITFQMDFYLEGQMDLLYLGPDGWEVMDYKTGAESKPLEDEETPFMSRALEITERNFSKYYGLQLGAYCLAVERLKGVRPVGAGIFHLGSNTLWHTKVTAEYCAEAYQRIKEIVEKIRAGKFELDSPRSCHCAYEWACPRQPASEN